MKYKATIIKDTGSYSKICHSLSEAGQWLDAENNNLENTTMIEAFDDYGNKKESFFYTEKAR